MCLPILNVEGLSFEYLELCKLKNKSVKLDEGPVA